jgi:integrase/recombinase XerC
MIPIRRCGSCPNGCELWSKQHRAIEVNYAYQARLEDVTAHTLRHSFAKNLVDSATPLDQVATLLGHESLDTTRIYATE